MSETKTYVFGNEGSTSNLLASYLPLLQQRGIDPAYLMGLIGNNNNGGFFGNNGGFQDIIALIVIAAIFGNGNFGFGGNNNSSTERELIMSAIQRNGTDLTALANALHCSTGQIDAAIGNVASQICNLAGQQGLSTERVINSILSGNAAISSQLASCCCDLKGAVKDVAIGQERGFSNLAYATQQQTCSIEKAIADSTNKVLEGQRAAELREYQDKLDALREKNAQQAVILNNAQQTSQFAAMLAPITQDLEKIKCKLPETFSVPYQPFTAVPNCVAAGYGLGWNGFGWNGSGSLWG